MLVWLDNFLERVLQTYRSYVDVVAAEPDLALGRLTSRLLLRVYASQTWDGQLDVNEFASVLRKLLDLTIADASIIARRLFPAFDRDNSGLLDFQEVFIGMAMLCSDSPEDRIRTVFAIMDADGNGCISFSELEQFLVAVAPIYTSRAAVVQFAKMMMLVVDKNNSGHITFNEVSFW